MSSNSGKLTKCRANRLEPKLFLLRRLKVVVLSALAAALLAGCSGVKDDSTDAGKPVPLEKIGKRVKLVKQWSRDFGAGQGKDYSRLSLSVSERGVCAADIKGRLRCYTHDGKKIQSRNFDGRLAGGVGASDDLIFVANDNGVVFALDAETGEDRWQYDAAGLVLAAPQANTDVALIQTADGRLIGVTAASGEKRWEYTSDEPLLTLRGTATPVIKDGVVYTGFASGKVVAIDVANGLPLWDQPVAIASGNAEIERIVDVDASPRVTDSSVYAASFNGNLYAFSRRNGKPLWRFETSTYREVATGLGKVYLVDENSRVYALGERDGEQRWEQSALLNRNLSAPIVFAGFMLVADYKGFLHVLSQVDGELIGRTRVDRAGVRVPMRVYNGMLYVYSNDGKLAAYTLKSLDR